MGNKKNPIEIDEFIRKGEISKLHCALGYRKDLVDEAFDNYDASRFGLFNIFKRKEPSEEN